MSGQLPQLTTPTAADMQLMMLIWGDSGSGKTTLAATAPGRKLFLLLDPGGDLSLADRDDVSVLNLCAQSPTALMAQFKTADPFGLNALLGSRPDFHTVVVDSMTSLAYTALQDAVTHAGGRSSVEQPGMQGYTWRNNALLRATVVIMRLCQQHKRHLILVTHEGNADRNADGVPISISMALSEGVANQVGLRFNECWHVRDDGTTHTISVRPCRLRKPMKTRLFNADKPEFEWVFDPATGRGGTIDGWFRAWQDGGGKKLPLPTRVNQTTRGGV